MRRVLCALLLAALSPGCVLTQITMGWTDPYYEGEVRVQHVRGFRYGEDLYEFELDCSDGARRCFAWSFADDPALERPDLEWVALGMGNEGQIAWFDRAATPGGEALPIYSFQAGARHDEGAVLLPHGIELWRGGSSAGWVGTSRATWQRRPAVLRILALPAVLVSLVVDALTFPVQAVILFFVFLNNPVPI